MLERFISNPLLLREVYSSADASVPGRASYPGVSKLLVICLVAASGFLVLGSRLDVISSSHWFLIAAFLQTWLWLRRSGSYSASAIGDADESGALAVIASSPQSLERALLFKLAGAMAPLGVEVLIGVSFNAVLFSCLGCVPWQMLLVVSGFQVALIAGGAGFGLILGRSLGNSAQAIVAYRKFTLYIGIMGICMMISRTMGNIALVAFVLYVLLSLLPAISDRVKSWTVTLAMGMIIIMPFTLVYDFTRVYEGAKNLNPYVALCQTCPKDLTSAATLRTADHDLYAFANIVFCRCTGAQKLADNPYWLRYFVRVLETDPQAYDMVNTWYLEWRLKKLLILALIVMLAFLISLVGVESSIKRKLVAE